VRRYGGSVNYAAAAVAECCPCCWRAAAWRSARRSRPEPPA